MILNVEIVDFFWYTLEYIVVGTREGEISASLYGRKRVVCGRILPPVTTFRLLFSVANRFMSSSMNYSMFS